MSYERGLYRLVGGLCEIDSGAAVKYRAALILAEQVVGKTIPNERVRDDLCKAIRLSLVNRRQYTFPRLQQRFDLPISRKTFWRERKKYVYAVAEKLGVI